ncbi:MAG: hypothetical protein GF313_10595, partial [Caldithrix sp.]|nr:hypothetical protein [Caldithrix sp.]
MRTGLFWVILNLILIEIHGSFANSYPSCQHDEPASIGYHHAYSVPFISQAPEIDGSLDVSLKTLPARSLSMVIKGDDANPECNIFYRMAYGTQFFYMFISINDTNLYTRDRAYQNGDGFNLVMARAKPHGKRTDEFYVLAGAAEKHNSIVHAKHFFWYYNVHTLFKPTSTDTKLQIKKKDDGITFELLLPWTEIYPYHPWLEDSLGFNLRVVKGTSNGSVNFYYAKMDHRLDSENSTRAYIPLKFNNPHHVKDHQSYVRLKRNHIQAGDSLGLQIATLSADTRSTELHTQINSAEGAII